jgi:sRNA-binding regulator protein Hfq
MVRASRSYIEALSEPEIVMPSRMSARSPAPKPKGRFSYAVEESVDRTIREQNRFLTFCMRERVELTLFAVTGASFNGIIHQFDSDTILFGGRGKNATPRMILKSFTAMIIPREGIDLFFEYKGLGTARSKNRMDSFIQTLETMSD